MFRFAGNVGRWFLFNCFSFGETLCGVVPFALMDPMNKISKTCLLRMRKSVVVVACAWSLAGQGAWAEDGIVSGFDLRGDGDIVRVQIETRVGVFGGASIAARGNEVTIELKGVDAKAVAALVDSLKQRPASIRGVHVLPGQDKTVRILLQMTAPSTVLDETVVAAGKDMSRWELVLGPAAMRADAPILPPALSSIGLRTLEGRAELVLSGSSGLVAEVSFEENPPRLLVDLPGVERKELVAAAKAFALSHPLIRRVRVAETSQLIFDLAETADLVDSAGTLEGEMGRVLISLAPDAAPRPVAARTARLAAIRVDELAGRLSFALSGIDASRINAYTLDEPPQLVIDFLGWTPKQLESAAAAFTPAHPAVRSVRVETTRLGSGRLVVELSGSAPLIAKTIDSVPAAQGDALQRTLTLALRTPLPGEAASESQMARSPLDLRFRRDLHDRARPSIIIRPVQLEGRWAQETPPADGKGSTVSLLALLQQALDTDPKYQAAKSDFEANREAVPQARAGYLPTASFDYQHSAIRQNVLRASNASFPTGESGYPSKSMTLTITQPILKAQAFVKMDQAGVAVEQARINLVASEQDLILRVAGSYLNLLAAKDGRELSMAEREATEKQFELARTRLERGLGTITQVHDTEARFALTEAREVEAGNKYDDARQALKEITGDNVDDVRGFRADFDASPPQPSAAGAWVQAAQEQNLALQSRNLALEIAGLEVLRQQAGYLPTLNAVGTMSRQDTGGSIYGSGQKLDNAELGFKLSLPLFEGGMTASLVREAVARKDKAEKERELELRRTERTTRSAFLAVQASARTLAALRKSVVAQDSALQARLQGFKSGIANIVAVVDAYRLFYAAKRDYLQARYDYLINRLRLKQSVGTLSRADLEDLGALLKNE